MSNTCTTPCTTPPTHTLAPSLRTLIFAVSPSPSHLHLHTLTFTLPPSHSHLRTLAPSASFSTSSVLPGRPDCPTLPPPSTPSTPTAPPPHNPLLNNQPVIPLHFQGLFSGHNCCSFCVSRPTSPCAHPSIVVENTPVGASLSVFAPLSSRVLVMSLLTAPSVFFVCWPPLSAVVLVQLAPSHSLDPLEVSSQLWWLAPSHSPSSHFLDPLPRPSSSIDPSILLFF
jgi:hypothetical protein